MKEIVITFMSDPKYMIFSHYMAQPKSMLCRKLVRILLEKTMVILSISGFQNVLEI